MKYLKEYNSSNTHLTTSDIDDIKDVFQDIIDEYSLILLGNNSQDSNIDASYHLLTNDTILTIKVYAPWENSMVVPFKDKKIIQSIDVDFIKRIRLMGYKVNKDIFYTRHGLRDKFGKLIDYIKIEISLK